MHRTGATPPNPTTPEDLVFPSPSGGYLDDMAIRRAFHKALAVRRSCRASASTTCATASPHGRSSIASFPEAQLAE